MTDNCKPDGRREMDRHEKVDSFYACKIWESKYCDFRFVMLLFSDSYPRVKIIFIDVAVLFMSVVFNRKYYEVKILGKLQSELLSSGSSYEVNQKVSAITNIM